MIHNGTLIQDRLVQHLSLIRSLKIQSRGPLLTDGGKEERGKGTRLYVFTTTTESKLVRPLVVLSLLSSFFVLFREESYYGPSGWTRLNMGFFLYFETGRAR